MGGRGERKPWRPAAPAVTNQISLESDTFLVSSNLQLDAEESRIFPLRGRMEGV